MSYRVGDTITLTFLESWATTGLANGDFTKILYLNGSSSAQTVTISEVGSGTSLPGSCAVGEYFHDTDSDDCVDTGSGDGAICVCKSTNTWALVANI